MADRNLCNLPAPVSVSDGIFGRKLRCAARSRDAAGDRGACSQRAFRILLFAADKHLWSNPDFRSAIAGWISASAFGDTQAGHRFFAVL